MQKSNNVTISNGKFIPISSLLKEIPIGAAQLRVYIKDGRLKATKIRNKFHATRKDFDDFKLALGF